MRQSVGTMIVKMKMNKTLNEGLKRILTERKREILREIQDRSAMSVPRRNGRKRVRSLARGESSKPTPSKISSSRSFR